MIQVENFTKVYKLSKKQMNEQKSKEKIKKAADGISFSAKEGQIFGLLGPNGAGKTTTLRTIATLIRPTDGNITVKGYDVVKDAKEVRRRIGFLTNDVKMDPHFTPSYLFTYFGRLHSVEDSVIEQRKEVLFNYFGIKGYENKKISELSTGMSQKLSIAISLVHDPDIVIFDEPTNGLDIITAKAVTEYLVQLREQGKLVIISTHIMNVAEKLCDKIAIIINGRKVAEGSVEEIVSANQSENLEDAFFELYKLHVGEV